MKPEAEFIGYQERPGLKPVPLFNIIKWGHEKYKSTVSALTLEKENIKIPTFPTFEEWTKLKQEAIWAN